MSWSLVPCLVELRGEFNEIAPDRDRSSDGSVGDPAHQDSQSDHNPDETGNVPIRDADKVNEVHAIDVDADLRVPGFSMEHAVQFLLHRCRSGAERRLRYIIFNRRIWSASNEWRQQAYTGANAHDKHAHFSASYATNLEASTASWHLQEALPVTAPTPEQNAAAVAARDVDPGPGTQTLGGGVWTLLTRSDYLGNTWAPAQRALLNQLDAKVDDQDDDLDALGASLAFLMSLVGQVNNEPAAGDPNVWYDVMRKAVADELDARDTPGE
jgi:hypothetical protein